MGAWQINRRAAVAAGSSLVLAACATPQPKAPKKLEMPKADVRPTAFLDELHLTKRQKERVDTLIVDLRAEFSDYDEARIILLDEVLAQIEKGAIDEKGLLPLAEAAIAGFNKGQPHALRTLDEFHALLIPEQREKFVKLWDKDDDSQKTDEEKRAAREAQLGRILDLNAGQKTRLYPALVMVYMGYWGTVSSMRNNLQAAKNSFARPDFAASRLKFFQELDLMEVARLISDALKVTLEVLEPPQRATLAAYLDARMR